MTAMLTAGSRVSRAVRSSQGGMPVGPGSAGVSAARDRS